MWSRGRAGAAWGWRSSAASRWTQAAGGSYGFWQILESNAPAIAFYAPIAVEDRSVLPCTLEGERFRALAAAAPEIESDG